MEQSHKFMTTTLAAAFGFFALSGVALADQNTSSANDNGSSNASRTVSDSWITTKVKADLATTGGLDSTKISVDTENGVVTLTGVLPDKIQVKKAVAATKSIEGVKDVDDSGLKVK